MGKWRQVRNRNPRRLLQLLDADEENVANEREGRGLKKRRLLLMALDSAFNEKEMLVKALNRRESSLGLTS